uniref:Serine/threonine/tyrosine-interacting protein n=1 Tax=Oncorhynchus tshawytscha TaxID=74940 RepID=A0AAZ3PCB5_ONCTS
MDEENKLQFPSLPPCKEDLLDWAYPMRREMQEILPGLFLGPYSAAMKSKLSILERQEITHLVCVRQDIEANFIKPNFPHKFRYLVLDIADNPVENIIRYFPMTKEFIDGCLASGGKVLVHGNAGISRSAALVIAYLMETFGVKYRSSSAVRLVGECRCQAIVRSPEMFDKVQVWALAEPLKDIQRRVPKPLLYCLGCVLRVIILLEGEPLSQSEVRSRFSSRISTLLRLSFP